MTIQTWLEQQRKLLMDATKGPWFDDKSCKNGHIHSNDNTQIAIVYSSVEDTNLIISVRTEHERALKIIEKMRKALQANDQYWDCVAEFPEDKACCSEHSQIAIDMTAEALAYFPDDCEVGDG